MADYKEILAMIDPSLLDYEEWLKVGLAIQHEGGTADEWETWSQRDFARYKGGECQRKWESFRGSASPVTAGSLVELARRQGHSIDTGTHINDHGHALDWDDMIGPVENTALPEPSADNAADFRNYLQALYQAEEHVGYVVDAWQDEKGKWMPKKGNYDRTQRELLADLAKNGMQGAVGDWEETAGAWIRFNPLDGNGVRDDNVTEYRHCLVESDSMPCERQLTIYRELELPCAAIVHSGGKSVHAIIKVDAGDDIKEYRQRVSFLYELLLKNGLAVDAQNRNPSRLSRLPGATRNGERQYLVDTNCGKSSWAEWREWIEDRNDNLPTIDNMADLWDKLPPLAKPIIDGVLREGHKMLVAGPSKAGKSYLLMQLAIAVAEGGSWLGWDVAKGRVLYVNLELDRASCLHRFRKLYKALGLPPKHAADISVWNLRGKSMPLDKLAPRIIRRAHNGNYTMVIVDPIYKVITGDENAADEMAAFCNQFDRVCSELGVATVYCHHHSKGQQGQKAAQDRASGSGVFARDPDAMLDMAPLDTSRQRDAYIGAAECAAMATAFDTATPGWREDCPQDDAIVADKLARWAEATGLGDVMRESRAPAREAAERATGWRIEGILREFPSFDPRNIWFEWPLHRLDDRFLADAIAVGEPPPKAARDKAIENQREDNIREVEAAYEDAAKDGQPVTVSDIAEVLGIDNRTVTRRIKAAAAISFLRFRKGIVFMEDDKTDNTRGVRVHGK